MLKQLVLIRLRRMLSAMSSPNKKGGAEKPSALKALLMSALYIFLFLSVAFIAFSLAYSAGAIFIPLGLVNEYFGLFMALALTVIFILSIFETKSELFDCKDNEFLLSLPIKPSNIVASRSIAVLIYNYVIEAVIMLPVVISFLMLGGDALGVVGSILVFLTLPLFATSLASAVGYLVARISRKLKNKNVVVLIISLAFLLLYFFGYSALMENFEAFLGGAAQNPEQFKQSVSFLGAIGAAQSCEPLSLLLYLFVSIGVSALTYFIISKNYIKIITEVASESKKAYRAQHLSQGGALSAILKKEFSRFFSSATYMLNAGLGLVFSLVLSIVALFSADMLSELAAMFLMTKSELSHMLAAPVFGVVGLVLGMTMMSCSALSLEGSELWIIKSLPVKAKTVLIAKTLPQAIISAPFALLSAILLSIALSAPWYVALVVTLGSLLLAVMFAEIGIMLNVAFPKFTFASEAEVVKQSIAVLLSMLINMVLSILIIIGGILIVSIMDGFLFSVLLLLLLAALVAVFYFVITGPCAKRYDNF